MKIVKTKLNDCYLLENPIFSDERGFFSPSLIENEIKKLGFEKVVQVNRSFNKKGVIRAFDFQKGEFSQAKIVEVLTGKIIDFSIDLRKDSDTYGMVYSQILEAMDRKQILIPRGFAHGFLALEDDTLFQYYVDNVYSPENEDGFSWDDPNLEIDWNELFKTYGIEKPIVLEKKLTTKKMSECEISYTRNK